VPKYGASAYHLNVASGDASGIPQAVEMGHCAVPITRKRVKEPAFDHDFLQEFCRLSWLQRFSLKIEFFETFGF
jgi:hypothetical protein